MYQSVSIRICTVIQWDYEDVYLTVDGLEQHRVSLPYRVCVASCVSPWCVKDALIYLLRAKYSMVT